MLTNNYYRLLEMLYKGSISGNYATFVDMNGTQKNIRCNHNNDLSYVYALIFDRLSLAANPSSLSDGIIFEDGTTTPTQDDYKLSGNSVSNLTLTHTLSRVADENGKITTTNTVTVLNANSNDVTIGEVGYFANITGYQPTSTAYSNGLFMLDHTVLEIPVTIPAGGIGQITYTISANLPTA